MRVMAQNKVARFLWSTV